MDTDKLKEEPEQAERTPEASTSVPGFAAMLIGVLIRPRRTFSNDEPERVPIYYGFLMVVLVSIITGINMAAIEFPILDALGSAGILGFLVLTTVLSISFWLLTVGTIAVMFELIGGSGTIRSLLAWYGMAMTPMLLNIPAMAIGLSIPELGTALSFIVHIWSIVLIVWAGMTCYRISVGRSILGTLIMPAVLVGIITGGILLLGVLVTLAIGIPDMQPWLP